MLVVAWTYIVEARKLDHHHSPTPKSAGTRATEHDSSYPGAPRCRILLGSPSLALNQRVLRHKIVPPTPPVAIQPAGRYAVQPFVKVHSVLRIPRVILAKPCEFLGPRVVLPNLCLMCIRHH